MNTNESVIRNNIKIIEAEKILNGINISIVNIIDNERVECSYTLNNQEIKELIVKLQMLNAL